MTFVDVTFDIPADPRFDINTLFVEYKINPTHPWTSVSASQLLGLNTGSSFFIGFWYRFTLSGGTIIGDEFSKSAPVTEQFSHSYDEAFATYLAQPAPQAASLIHDHLKSNPDAATMIPGAMYASQAVVESMHIPKGCQLLFGQHVDVKTNANYLDSLGAAHVSLKAGHDSQSKPEVVFEHVQAGQASSLLRVTESGLAIGQDRKLKFVDSTEASKFAISCDGSKLTIGDDDDAEPKIVLEDDKITLGAPLTEITGELRVLNGTPAYFEEAVTLTTDTNLKIESGHIEFPATTSTDDSAFRIDEVSDKLELKHKTTSGGDGAKVTLSDDNKIELIASGGVRVDGNLEVNGTLSTVDGQQAIFEESVTIRKGVNGTGSLFVGERLTGKAVTTQLNGMVEIGNYEDPNDPIRASANLKISGWLANKGAFANHGTAIFHNSLTVMQDQLTTLGGNLTVADDKHAQFGGTVTIADSKKLIAGGELQVKEAAALDSSVDIGGALTVAADQATELNGTLTVAADKHAEFGGTMTIADGKKLIAGGELQVKEAAAFDSSLTVAADKHSQFGGTVTIAADKTLSAGGDVEIASGHVLKIGTYEVKEGQVKTDGGAATVPGLVTAEAVQFDKQVGIESDLYVAGEIFADKELFVKDVLSADVDAQRLQIKADNLEIDLADTATTKGTFYSTASAAQFVQGDLGKLYIDENGFMRCYVGHTEAERTSIAAIWS